MKTRLTLIIFLISGLQIFGQHTDPDKLISSNSVGGELHVDVLQLPNTDIAVLGESSRAGDTIFVSASANGASTGVSWNDAYNSLSVALASALPDDQIWVAQGEYTPDSTLQPLNTNVFNIDIPLQLYGGFDGTESELHDRSIADHPTILSGDIRKDDIDNDLNTNKSDNSIHVLFVMWTEVIIDGFIIEGGASIIDIDNPLDLENIGGGILNSGRLQINNCTIQQNMAQGGGGIYTVGGKCTMTNCLFQDNYAEIFGGGLCMGNTDMDISNSEFRNNSTASTGGGLFIFQNSARSASSARVNLNGNVFEQNTALYGGGAAINNFAPDLEINMDSCTFSDNECGLESVGGGLLIQNVAGQSSPPISILAGNITNTTFTNNYSSDAGGAMYLVSNGEKATFHLDNCVVDSNKSESAGGVYIGVINETEAEVRLNSCEFDGNMASADAGAMYVYCGQNLQIDYTIDSCVFKNNSASNYGGAALTLFESQKNEPGLWNNCLFESNSAGLSCGALSSNNENATFNNCQFMTNDAGYSASAVCLTVFPGSYGSQNLIGCNFEANATTEFLDTTDLWINNGALEVWSDGAQDVYISDTRFTSNTTKGLGGAMTLLTSDTLNVILENCGFESNYAEYQGGAILALGLNDSTNGHITIENSEIVSNSCDLVGGGVLLSNWDVNISSSIFSSNESQSGGGNVVLSNGATVVIKDSEIIKGRSNVGAGIYSYVTRPGARQTTIELDSCRFFQNISFNTGGGIQLQAGSNELFFIAKKSLFTENAAESGGAMYSITGGQSSVDHDLHINIDECVFDGNRANVYGGAITNWTSGDSLNFRIQNSQFLRNEVRNAAETTGGGGIMNAGVVSPPKLYYNIKSCLFDSNKSAGISGGIWNTSGNPAAGTYGEVTDCKFLNNSATFCCGGLGVAFDKGVYTDNYFEGNSTMGRHSGIPGGGGAGFILNKEIVIRNSEFANNESSGPGAGLYMVSGGEYVLENVLFKNHEGESAVYNDCEVDLINGTFIQNDAAWHNGSSASLAIGNSIFDNPINITGNGSNSSLGGNICSDMSMSSILTHSGTWSDLNGVDPDLDADGYPTKNSPCVDQGNPDLIMSTTDAHGNIRSQGNQVDRGALESPWTATSIHFDWDDQHLEVFPVPAKNHLFIQTKDLGEYTYQLYSNTGKLVLEGRPDASNGNDVSEISLGDLVPGAYYLVVHSGDKGYGKKLVVE